jgi:hypothetical protein
MKSPVLKILLILLILLSISTGCASRKAITEEFIDCFIQMNAGAVDNVAKNLEIIDQNLYTTEEKLLKLQQVVVPSLEWIENQKVELLEKFKYGSLHSHVTQEGLAKFKNDQYEITTLEVTVYEIGTPNQNFRTMLKVTDLATKANGDWETFESELKWRKSTLEKQRQEKLEDAQLSTSTLLSMLEHSGDWEIRKVNSTTYSISGFGLGAAGELTSGEWLYYRDSKTVVPADTQSLALQKILSGGF